MQLSSNARKAVAVGLTVSTLLWSAMLSAPLIASAAVHTDGCIVISNGTAWFITGGTRRGFPSAEVFQSYGYNFGQLSQASAEDLALPVGPIMVYADGTLVKGPGDPLVYLVTSGQKRGFTSGAVFSGGGYSFSNVQSAPFNTFADLPTGANMNDTVSAHPAGVTVLSNGTVWLMSSTGRMGYPSMDVFASHGMTLAKVVAANAADLALPQTGVVVLLSGCGGFNPPPPPSGSVSVSLASDNPAAGSIVAGQASADLLHPLFNGTGTVSQITLQRTGVSTNTAVNNVYLYRGTQRITDAASINTNGLVTFNNLNLAISGPQTLAVKADIASTATAGQTLGMTLVGFMLSGDSVMTNANVQGNLFTIASGTGLLAGVNFTSASLTPTGTPTVNAGSTGYSFWQIPVQVNTHSVYFKSLQLQLIGSAPFDALSNIQLYVNGAPIGSPVAVVNGFVFFDLNAAPPLLPTGTTTLEVRADVQKGSNRTVQFALQNSADFTVTDSQLNVNVSPTVNNAAFSPLTAASVLISQGTLSAVIDPTFQSLTNVTGGATNAVIGRFRLHAYGEDIKVMTLVIQPGLSGTIPAQAGGCPGNTANGLNNVALYFGSSLTTLGQVGSSQNWCSGTLSYTLGSSMIAPAGTDSWLEIRADMQNNAFANYTAGTVTSAILFGSSSAQGLSSLNTTNVLPASTLTTSGLTIQTGTLSVSKSSYADQNANPNTSGVKIAEFTMQNNSSSEGVRVTNLSVGLTRADGTTVLTNTASSGVFPALTNFSNLRTTETSGSGSTPINPTAANNFSVNFTLPPGGSTTIGILADTSTDSTGSQFRATLLPTALGASSNVSLTPAAATVGQLITLTSGALGTPTFTSSGSTPQQYIAASGGSVDGSTNSFNFVSTGGAANLSELKFAVKGAVPNTVASVKVGGSSAVVSTPAATTLTTAVAANPANTTLNGGIDGVTTTVTVTSGAGIVSGANITVTTAGGAAEQMLVTNVAGAVLTVVRGFNGTVAIAHLTGEVVSNITNALVLGSTANLGVGSVITVASVAPEDFTVLSVIDATHASVLRTLPAGTHTGTEAATIAGTAYLTGLSIAVPNGGGGIFVNALPTYASVGTNGVASGSLSTLLLSYVRFTSGGSTLTRGLTPLAANTMNMVGSVPILSVTTTSNAGLLVGENHLFDVTITPNAKGPIAVGKLEFSISPSGTIVAPAATTTSTRLALGSTTIAGVTCTVVGTAPAVDTCVFPANYQVTSATTFTLFGTTTGTLGAAGTSSITTTLTVADNFSWFDTAGSNPTAFTGGVGPNHTYLFNYPTQTWSLHN